MPLNDSFKSKAQKQAVTQLSTVPTAEDLAFASAKAKPGNPSILSWRVGPEKRVLYIIPSAGSNQPTWIMRSEERFDAPVLWRYVTHDAAVIHNMIEESPIEGQTAIPEELRPRSAESEAAEAASAHAAAPSLTKLKREKTSDFEVNEEDFLPGKIFAERYEIVSFIGSGGMGAVYQARQISIDRFVALKVLHPHLVADPISKKRFEHEAKAASSLMHQNLIVVHDFGFSKKGQPFIVMDYLNGPTLHDLVEQEGPLELSRFIKVFTQCCRALTHAHEKNLVHRDIKPCNIVLAHGDHNVDLVKILDFGIAKVVDGKNVTDQSFTNTGIIVGSPYFMSPEQCCSKPVDARSDIYSLGCVMYVAAVAAVPFFGDDAFQTMHSHIYELPPPFNSVRPDLCLPQELEEIVFKALEKDPEARYQSAEELERDLDRLRAVLLENWDERVPEITAIDVPIERSDEPVILASDILVRAGVVGPEDILAASTVRANLGGDLNAILVAQGKLDYYVSDAANKCKNLVASGKITFDHAVILVGYCHRSKVNFEKAIKDLGWDKLQI